MSNSLSNSQLDKAGEVIRKGIRGEIPTDDRRIDDAIADIGAYRASFETALESVTNKLREIVVQVTGGERNPVASRPKIFAAIASKLYKLRETAPLGRCSGRMGSATRYQPA